MLVLDSAVIGFAAVYLPRNKAIVHSMNGFHSSIRLINIYHLVLHLLKHTSLKSLILNSKTCIVVS